MIRTIRTIARAERFAAATAKKLDRPQDGAHSLAAPAAPDQSGDPAADGEADHGRTDDRRRAVLAHLTAPVGEGLDLRAQVLDRHRKLMAGPLDRAADLVWAPGRHARAKCSASRRGCLPARPRAPGARASRASASPPRS